MICMGGLIMCMFLISPHANAITCNTVYSDLYPCLSYVTGTGPLQASCCNGVRSLYGAAQTTIDRQNVCSCLKQVASSGTGSVNLNNAAALPGQCGVTLPYKISPSIDCKK